MSAAMKWRVYGLLPQTVAVAVAAYVLTGDLLTTALLELFVMALWFVGVELPDWGSL